MKYSFGNSTLGQSLLTLLNLHFMAPRKNRYSIALKRAGYALFSYSDILVNDYVNMSERATLALVPASRKWGEHCSDFHHAIRIPLNQQPDCGFHKIALVVAYNPEVDASEYYFQIKTVSGVKWVTVASHEQRREMLEMISRFCDPLKGRIYRLNAAKDLNEAILNTKRKQT